MLELFVILFVFAVPKDADADMRATIIGATILFVSLNGFLTPLTNIINYPHCYTIISSIS